MDFLGDGNYKNIKLLESCYLNDIHEVKLLINKGIDVNYVHKGETALLKSCGATIDVDDEFDVDINIEIVNLLIEHGTNVNYENDEGETPLIAARRNKNHSLIKLLIEKGADINYENKKGLTALMSACGENDIESVKILLTMGVDVNYISKNGNTALLSACDMDIYSGYVNDKELCVDLIKLLVICGANINHKNHGGRSVFYSIFERHDYDLIESLIDFCDDIECVDIHGNTILIWCCYRGNIVSVDYLVKRGANVNVVNSEECTPLIYACTSGDIGMVRYLLKSGANPDHQNNIGHTPLICACIDGDIDMVNLLINYNADINYVNKNKDCALTYACINNHVEIVKLLLKRGSYIKHDINYDIMFITPSYFKNYNIIEILLCAGYSYKELTKPSNFENNLCINDYLKYKRIAYIGLNLGNFHRYAESIDGIIFLEKYCEENIKYNGLKRELREPVASDIFSYMVLVSDGYYTLGNNF